MIRKWRKRKSVLMWSSHASTTTLLPLKVQMAISLPWLRSARESLDRKRKTDASCRFLEIIPAMMEGKKCTGICTLANVRRMSIYTGEVPLAIASSQLSVVVFGSSDSIPIRVSSIFLHTRSPELHERQKQERDRILVNSKLP
jgi:hypothetical protein